MPPAPGIGWSSRDPAKVAKEESALKNPLRYQMSEYDCGPTAMLNAVSYLFERDEIPPEIIRNIMLYSLDCYGSDGSCGKRGTSCTAMMFLSNWLNGFGTIGQLNISSHYLSGQSVFLGSSSLVEDALRRGGAVVARVFLDEWHYILLTGIKDGDILVFDPYYRMEPFPEAPDVEIVTDQPFVYNRIIPAWHFNQETLDLYSFGPPETREAVLIFNEKSKLTEEQTVEYMI